jgi:hypothetical protein
MGFNWGQGGSGAAGGAATGFALSGGNPIGAGIGALAGGLMGGLGGSSQPSIAGFDRRGASFLEQIRRTEDPRDAVQLGAFERSGGGEQFRGGQQQLIRQLQQQAAGRGPSLAGLQANAVAQRSLAQQQALAAGAAPGNEALAARQAAMNAGNTMQDLAGTSAQARMAEQMQARAMLGGVLGQARGQDIGNEQFNAGSANNRTLAQGSMEMNQRQLNDARNMQLRQLEMNQALAKAGMQQSNTMGTQIMSGGANLLAQYGMGAFRGQPGAGEQSPYAGGLPYGQTSYGNNVMQPNF